ncbi:MAG: DsbA family protein [Terracidiphilus sp.]
MRIFFLAPSPLISARSRRSAGLALCLVSILLLAPSAHAQFGAPQTIQVLDASALHPPAGARVAIVEFSDPECPACARANPLLMQAATHYKIPWVRHDILIPGHVWSPVAAVFARWFDSKSPRLGDDYRNQVFANQASIETRDQLGQFTDRFAQSHGISIPFAIDPQGKLAAAVQADSDLGRRTGIVRTPTVFIVIANSKAAPYIQVLNIDQDLYRDIDQALANVRR